MENFVVNIYIYIFKLWKLFLSNIFFYSQGLRPPAPTTGAAPLDPPYFWIEDPSRNRLALNGISAKIRTRIFVKSFLTFFFSQNRLKRMLNIFFGILTNVIIIFNSNEKKNVRQKFVSKNFPTIFNFFFLYKFFFSS